MKKPVRTSLEGKAASPQGAPKAIIIANGIAALFMFLSWLGQNIYQSEVGSIKSDIERDVQFSNGEMTKALQWMLTFQTERRKEKPDPEIILNSAMGYAETVGSIVEAANRVDPNSLVLTSQVRDFQKLIKPLRDAANRRNLQEIEETSSVMMLWFKSIGPKAHEAINARAEKVYTEENRGKWIFRAFFMLGSLVLALTWWRSHLSPTSKHGQTA